VPIIDWIVIAGSDVAEIMSRIVRYLSGANHIMMLPLAEVILTNKDKGYRTAVSSVLCLSTVIIPAKARDYVFTGVG